MLNSADLEGQHKDRLYRKYNFWAQENPVRLLDDRSQNGRSY